MGCCTSTKEHLLVFVNKSLCFIFDPGKGYMSLLACIQLLRVRLSNDRGKAYSTMPKVIMGNGGFKVA